MTTLFDYLTIACLFGMAGAFFILTTREFRTLLQLVLAAFVFAIADQVGNAGYAPLGIVLIIAGAIYAAILVWHDRARG